MNNEPKVPKQVIIEVTSRCNLACKFCPSVTNESFPNGDMDLETFKHIADLIKAEMPDTTVIPWVNGEPFLHPDYLSMVQYLSKSGLRFYVTTNLTIPKPDILRFLLSPESTCYQIIVSMDGLPGSKSLELARPGTNGEALVRAVEDLLELKAMLRSKVDVAVKICERGQDWEEIENYIQFWLEKRPDAPDYVCVGKPLKGENEESMRRHPCQYFDHNFMVIRWNGTCVPCAYNDMVSNKGMLNYGYVDEETTSLLDVYNNELISLMRKNQNEGTYPYPCSNCSFAYTGYGYNGTITFRRDHMGRTYQFHQDYYNSFFSKKINRKPNHYYLN